MVTKATELNPKQQRFVEEFLIDFNGTQAAIRAGYSKKTARQIATELLSKPHVSHAIGERRNKLTEECDVKTEFIIEGLKEVAGRCLTGKVKMIWDYSERELVPAVDADGNMIYEFDSQGANRAFELLGKYKGLFIEKVEHTGQLSLVEAITSRMRARAEQLRLNGRVHALPEPQSNS